MRRNQHQWVKDDLVIHANESKETKMLRTVVRVDGDKVFTRYAFPELLPASWMSREMCDLNYWLHDPKNFHISVSIQGRAA